MFFFEKSEFGGGVSGVLLNSSLVIEFSICFDIKVICKVK